MSLRRVVGSALAGLGATLFMEQASTKFYGRQSAQSRQREEQLRTEMPTTTLVHKAAGLVGKELIDERVAFPMPEEGLKPPTRGL